MCCWTSCCWWWTSHTQCYGWLQKTHSLNICCYCWCSYWWENHSSCGPHFRSFCSSLESHGRKRTHSSCRLWNHRSWWEWTCKQSLRCWWRSGALGSWPEQSPSTPSQPPLCTESIKHSNIRQREDTVNNKWLISLSQKIEKGKYLQYWWDSRIMNAMIWP